MGKLVILQIASDVVFGRVVVADDLDLSVRLSHQLEQLLAVLPIPCLRKNPHPNCKGICPDPSALVDNVFDGHANIGNRPGENVVREIDFDSTWQVLQCLRAGLTR